MLRGIYFRGEKGNQRLVARYGGMQLDVQSGSTIKLKQR
jgi:hypothetical protein